MRDKPLPEWIHNGYMSVAATLGAATPYLVTVQQNGLSLGELGSGLAVGVSSTASGILTGKIANALHDRFRSNLLDAENLLDNHHLFALTGRAVASLVNHVSESSAVPQQDLKDALTKLSDAVVVEWDALCEVLPDVRDIPRTELLQWYRNASGEDGNATALTVDSWRVLLAMVNQKHHCGLSDEVLAVVSETLYLRLPIAVRELLKDDCAAQDGGHAFAGFLIKVLGEIYASINDLAIESNLSHDDIKQQFRDIVELLNAIQTTLAAHAHIDATEFFQLQVSRFDTLCSSVADLTQNISDTRLDIRSEHIATRRLIRNIVTYRPQLQETHHHAAHAPPNLATDDDVQQSDTRHQSKAFGSPPLPTFAGVSLHGELHHHTKIVNGLAWSPDGRYLASASCDSTVCVYDWNTRELSQTFEGHVHWVFGLAWSPSSNQIASCSADSTVRIWRVDNAEQVHLLQSHSGWVYAVDWSPNGHMLASGAGDGFLVFSDPETGELVRRIHTFSGSVFAVAFSPDGSHVATGSENNSLSIWDTTTGKPVGRFSEHHGMIKSVAWSPDGATLASASADQTVRIWNADDGRCVASLEGFTRDALSVSFSSDGQLLAAKSVDQHLRVWETESWKPLIQHRAREKRSASHVPSIAFDQSSNRLALLHDRDRVISVVSLERHRLSSLTSTEKSVQYTNAKVVLVGDSGVGKTKLGFRLAENRWNPEDKSSHGMHVWNLHAEADKDVLLWDFAGQPEYRLVHQMFLNQANVALLLYDPTKSDDYFAGVNYWMKALERSVLSRLTKLFVAARIDVGNVRMLPPKIEQLCAETGFDGHLETSSYTGEGCDRLKEGILNLIDWARLPKTSSPEVFKHIKTFVIDVRDTTRYLVRQTTLYAEFCSTTAHQSATEDQFKTVIGHVENTGLIKRLSFGDLVLLKPELLNSFASDVIDAARKHPDGLGCVDRSTVLNGGIPLSDATALQDADRCYMLHATVEEFLRLGLAFEQDGQLVFPAKFNDEMPALAPDAIEQCEITFEGPVDSLYTTLVVKLYYGGSFSLVDLWKNSAVFESPLGTRCGFKLTNVGDGSGVLRVFSLESIRDGELQLFESAIETHFQVKGATLSRSPIVRCPRCNEVAPDKDALQKAIDRNITLFPCQYCFEKFDIGEVTSSKEVVDQDPSLAISRMERHANERLELEGDEVAALAELRSERFAEWARDFDEVAIAWVGMANSDVLREKSGEDEWSELKRSFLAASKFHITMRDGYCLKEVGSGLVAAFTCATKAVEFAVGVQATFEREFVKIDASVSVGPPNWTAAVFDRVGALTAHTRDPGTIYCDDVTRNQVFQADTIDLYQWQKVHSDFTAFDAWQVSIEGGFLTGRVSYRNGDVAKNVPIQGVLLSGVSTDEVLSDEHGAFALKWPTREPLVQLKAKGKVEATNIRSGDQVEITTSRASSRKQLGSRRRPRSSGGRRRGRGF